MIANEKMKCHAKRDQNLGFPVDPSWSVGQTTRREHQMLNPDIIAHTRRISII